MYACARNFHVCFQQSNLLHGRNKFELCGAQTAITVAKMVLNFVRSGIIFVLNGTHACLYTGLASYRLRPCSAHKEKPPQP